MNAVTRHPASGGLWYPGIRMGQAEPSIESLWSERGVDPTRVIVHADGTIGDAARATVTRSSVGPIRERPTLDLPESRGELVLRDELGRGGRGLVVRAEQVSLGREVAVKRSLDGGLADLELVEEAWTLAHLAHPNVVPVHALVSVDARPALAMKRVDGEPWSRRLARRERSAGCVDEVRVLIEVIRAIEHAHRAGVLHLDLKPANVMLGAFGEVYVVDWGLAARTGPSPDFLPLAASLSGPAGTPAYMAPEQALGDASKVAEGTDIYLLGGILFEILVGEPPHPGTSPYIRMFHAATSTPLAFPAEPQALVAIGLHAMASEPAQRFPSAGAMRAALEQYLREREGIRELERGREARKELVAAIARGADPYEVDRLFGASRFALRNAHRELRANGAVDEEYILLFEAMAAALIARGELARAEALLEVHPSRRPELHAALSAAREAAAAASKRRRALADLGRAHDLTTERSVRSRTVLFLATLFLLSNLALGALGRHGFEVGFSEMGTAVAIGGALIVLVGTTLRHAHFPNRAASALWGVCIALAAPVLGHWCAGIALGLPFQTTLAMTPLYYVACLGILSTFFDARVWPAAALQLVTALACLRWPGATFELIGAGGFLSLAQIAHQWSRPA